MTSYRLPMAAALPWVLFGLFIAYEVVVPVVLAVVPAVVEAVVPAVVQAVLGQ